MEKIWRDNKKLECFFHGIPLVSATHGTFINCSTAFFYIWSSPLCCLKIISIPWSSASLSFNFLEWRFFKIQSIIVNKFYHINEATNFPGPFWAFKKINKHHLFLVPSKKDDYIHLGPESHEGQAAVAVDRQIDTLGSSRCFLVNLFGGHSLHQVFIWDNWNG